MRLNITIYYAAILIGINDKQIAYLYQNKMD